MFVVVLVFFFFCCFFLRGDAGPCALLERDTAFCLLRIPPCGTLGCYAVPVPSTRGPDLHRGRDFVPLAPASAALGSDVSYSARPAFRRSLPNDGTHHLLCLESGDARVVCVRGRVLLLEHHRLPVADASVFRLDEPPLDAQQPCGVRSLCRRDRRGGSER